MGAKKDELTIGEAVAREAPILRDSTGTSAGSTSSRSPGKDRRRRRNNVRVSMSVWVEDRRRRPRRGTTGRPGS